MMIIYLLDNQYIFSGEMEISPTDVIPAGVRFTETPPPSLTGDEVARWNGVEWTVLESRPPAPVVAPDPRGRTVLEFKRRFTPAERITMRSAAAVDPIIADFLDILDTTGLSGSKVYSDDADLIAGMGYMVSQGHITQPRAEEILA